MAIFRSSVFIVLVAVSLAAAPGQQGIAHVSPPSDSVGAQPKRFEWTAVPNADGYALLLVNEVDIEMWEVTVRTNVIEVPKDLVLDFGTYYWAVGAFSGGRQVAYSGRSAFVVLR